MANPPARLIINADDFGLTAGINRSIEELHHAGALSSATLMATGPAFDHALAIAQRNPALGVGCHVTLVDGVPVSPPETIPSLLGRDRKTFRPSLLEFVAAALSGRLRRREIRTEALAQIRKLQHAGLSVTHVDTHKHAHIFPVVSRALLDAAREASVRAIRNPFEPRWSTDLASKIPSRRLQVRVLRKLFERHLLESSSLQNGSIATTDGTIGIAATGQLNAATLQSFLDNLPPGTWELVCHPGYNDPDLAGTTTRLRAHRDIERTALLDIIPKAFSAPNAPSLINYRDLYPQ